ncbi:hypothetical protein NX059_009620 [Plenodomus lindquistii]|nr:hypothetical protein NX059_009620 [Plenodomus lindquistii]
MLIVVHLLLVLSTHSLIVSLEPLDSEPTPAYSSVDTGRGTKQVAHSHSSHNVTKSSSPQPSLVHIAAGWNPNNLPSAVEWRRYADKGSKLRCMMEATDVEAGRMWPDPMNRQPPSASSRWRGTIRAGLRTWYWHEGQEAQSNCDFSTHRIEHVLASLGISSLPRERGGDNMCFSIDHYDENAVDKDGDEVAPEDQYYVVGQRSMRATGAHYRFGLNPRSGAIFAQSLLNPSSAAQENWNLPHAPSAEQLPQLRLPSDIIFAYWYREAPHPQNLQYYFVNHVVNRETVRIVAGVLQNKGVETVPQWPGVVVGGGTEEAAALIGELIVFSTASSRIEDTLV